MTAAIVSGGGRMQYRVLGPVQARRNGEDISLGRRPQMLLALLLINANQVVSTDRIIDELWGDEPGRDPQNALWVVVSRLRGLLDPGREKRTDGSILITQHPGYKLAVDPDAVDASRFEALAQRGRHLLDSDPATSAACLAEALGLWGGRAYEPFTYDEFAVAEIARLEEMRLEAVEDRMEAELALGHERDLVASLEGLVREHPARQRLVGQLMRSLHLAGRQSDALRVFAATRSRLIEEHGLDPTAELMRLEEKILLDDPSLRVPSTSRGTSGTQTLSVRGYELRERVQASMSGDVYRAYQPAVGREVEVRVIPAELANDPDFIRRFEAEAQLVAQLDNPQIVPIFDFWREPDSAYLVTRRFERGTLRALLDERTLEVDELVTMLGQIGGAIVAAHRRGIAHGAISPEQVVVDSDGNAYLGGFGQSSTIDLLNNEADPAKLMDHRKFAELSRVLLQHTVNEAGSPFVIGPELDSLLDHHVEVSDGLDGFTDFVDELLATIGDQPVTVSTARNVLNPYQGLRAFGEDDAGQFHGRERLVERLVSRIGFAGPQGRFVAVVGPSGSGKSSVVRAGVIPALRNGAAPGSERWFIVTMTPGRDAFQSLADALQRIAVEPPAGLAERLEADGISLCVERISPDPSSQVLIVIDQFEELFTQSADAEAFIDALSTVVADKHSGVKIVATLRADFYDRPLQYAALGDPLRLGTEVITPMSPEELERAITRPAGGEGVEFEPGVVARITSDMAAQPAALPLLQHALAELFERRERDVIGATAYEAVGGVGGALARRADALLADLDDRGRSAARNVFLRLVTVQDGSADTRRRATLRELRDVGGVRADRILELFGDHRLLTFDQDPSTRAPTAEIAHEALLTRWRTLSVWIDDARAAVHAQRRLAEAANEWTAAGEDPGLVVAGSRLANYAGWIDHPPVPLTEREQRFLRVSEAAGEAELEVERTRATRFRRVATVAAAAFVIATIAAGLAIWQQGRASDAADVAEQQAARAEDQTEVAQEQRIIAERAAQAADLERMRAQAVAESGSNAPLAALLAAEAFQIDGSHLSAGAIQRVLTSVDGRRATLADGPSDYGGESVISGDGSLLAASTSSTLDVWDIDAQALLLRIPSRLTRFDMTRDGSMLAHTSLAAPGVRLVDVVSGDTAGLISSQPCRRLQFSPDGTRLALVANGNDEFECDVITPRFVEIWDISDPGDPALVTRRTDGNVWEIGWNPDGESYVTVDAAGGTIDYWNAETHQLLWQHRFVGSAQTDIVAEPTSTLFARDGGSVVVGVSLRASLSGIQLISLDTATGELLAEPTPTGGLVQMGWWDEAETLLVGSIGGAGVAVFDLANATEIQPPPLVNPNAASIHVDHERGRRVISGFVGIEVSSLDGTSGLEQRIPLTPEQLAVKLETDGQFFASINAAGTRALISTLDLTGRSPVVEWDLTTEPPTRIADHPPGFTVNSHGATLLFSFASPEPSLQVLDPNHDPVGGPIGLEIERGFPVVWRASADGSRHAPHRNTNFLDVYDAATGERLHSLTIPGERPGEDSTLTGIYSFTDDGSRVLANFASVDRGRVWGLFDTDTGELLRSGSDELGLPWIAGDVIYSNPPGSFDLERLDVETFEPVGPPLIGHTVNLGSLRDDPASDVIITQAQNGTVRVWDRETGDQIGDGIDVGRQSSGIDLTTAQENRMVGVQLDTELAIWNYDFDTWPDLACELAGRNMTQREWQEVGPQGVDYRATCPQFPPGE